MFVAQASKNSAAHRHGCITARHPSSICSVSYIRLRSFPDISPGHRGPGLVMIRIQAYIKVIKGLYIDEQDVLQYSTKSLHIKIFWGSNFDFLIELHGVEKPAHNSLCRCSH